MGGNGGVCRWDVSWWGVCVGEGVCVEGVCMCGDVYGYKCVWQRWARATFFGVRNRNSAT